MPPFSKLTKLQVTGDVQFDSGLPELSMSATARTATADGTGTGAIAAGSGFVLVTSSSANNIVTLPAAPTAGDVILIAVGANGCELRSDTPASVSINGGSGANAELALAANSLTICVALSATAWLAQSGSPTGFNMAAAAA